MKKWNKSDKSRKTKRGAIGIQSHKSCPKKERWFLPEVLTGHESWTSSPASATNSSTSAVEKFYEELTGRDIKTMRCHNCSFFMAKKNGCYRGGKFDESFACLWPFCCSFWSEMTWQSLEVCDPCPGLIIRAKDNNKCWRVESDG